MSPPRVVFALVSALLLSGPFAQASIINVTFNPGSDANTFVYLTPPWGSLSSPANTVGANTFQNNTTLYAFDEFIGFLSAPVTPNLGPMSVIPAGTPVVSHFIFFDPRNQRDVLATIQFDQPILGVIRMTSTLNATDPVFAHPLINYLTPSARGLEGGDRLTITGPNTIDIDWTASSPGDYVRVITSAFIPEPVSIALCGLGVAAACLLSRVSRRRIR